jgi:hypothetical protein
MTSSIFSSDSWSRARAVPGRAVFKWLGYAIAGAATMALCVNILERSNPATQPWNGSAAEILFVGTSHAANGIDASVFGGTAGVVSFRGLDHRLAAATIARHAERWPRLLYALLEVDEFTLLTDMTQTSRDNPLELLAGLDLPLTALPPAPDRRAWWMSRLVLSGKGTAALDSSLRLTTQRLFYDRRKASRAVPLALTPAAGNNRVRFLERVATGQVADNVRALADLTQLLTTRGVKVVLLSYPQHRHYREARRDQWDRHIAQAVTAVNAVLPEVPFWDYRADAGFDDADFTNVDHLNKSGAVKLSRIVANRLSIGASLP